ncbi:hypothetical protein SLS57_008656 [Botryosphaeria dothidea]
MAAPQPRQLLCLTMLGYMKEGLDEEALCDFQVNKHARLVSGLMEKYGIVRYTITHNSKKTRAMLPKLFDPRYVEYSDHDFVVRIIFPSLEAFEKVKQDPFYMERIAKDHLNFADRNKRTRMTLGYVHEIIHEGKVVDVEDPDTIACAVNNVELNEKGTFEKHGAQNGVENGTNGA